MPSKKSKSVLRRPFGGAPGDEADRFQPVAGKLVIKPVGADRAKYVAKPSKLSLEFIRLSDKATASTPEPVGSAAVR